MKDKTAIQIVRTLCGFGLLVVHAITLVVAGGTVSITYTTQF